MSEEFLKKISEIVETNLDNQDFGAEDLSREIGLSRSQIHRKLQSGTGLSISQLIREIRLQYAHEMLQNEEGTAAEIAYKVGFSSPSYFNKCFNDHFGYPPGEISKRRRKREKVFNTKSHTGSDSISAPRVFYVMATALIAVLVYGFLDQQSEGQNYTPTNQKSIAVLPFKTIGDDPEGTYFAAGVQDEILNRLSRLSDIKVKSRTAVEKFQERPPTTEELLNELKLTHYLEGSTQKKGNQIRITIQLIEATSEDHLWAQSYDFDYSNIWDIQSSIASNVAEVLKVQLTPELTRQLEKRPTDNPDAWDDYLRAIFYWREYKETGVSRELEKMASLLRSAIRKDPQFALAYSTLAMSFQQVPGDVRALHGFVKLDSILWLCNKAIELDSTLSEPHLQKARFYARINPVMASDEYKLALAKGPDKPLTYREYAWFKHWVLWDIAESINICFEGISKEPESWLLSYLLRDLGTYYLAVNHHTKAEYYFEQALSLDPNSIEIMVWMMHLYRVSNQLEKQEALIPKISKMNPVKGHWESAMYHLLKEEYGPSAEHFSQYYERDISDRLVEVGELINQHMYAFALLKTGRTQEAHGKFEMVKELLKAPSIPTPDYEYAKIYAATGQEDSAFYHLTKALNENIHLGLSHFMETDPLFMSIRQTPKFRSLVNDAKNRVSLKRKEVEELENSGVIPTQFNLPES